MAHAGDDSQSLLTQKAFALALSPPRAPPVGTAHSDFLLGKDSSQSAQPLLHHPHDGGAQQHQAHSHDPHHTLRQRLHQLLHKSHRDTPSRLPHPHLASGPEISDKITRYLGVLLPVQWHNTVRDSGGFRFLLDAIVTTTAPTMAITQPGTALKFLKLTASSQRIRYGSHPRHYLDLYLPEQQQQQPQRLVFFVHGGAWGSGLPWFYRLAALPFLQEGWAVAVPGYRTYPDGSAAEQVADLESAAAALVDQYPYLCQHVTVMGHSSGAHIALLMVVDRVRRNMFKSQEEQAKSATPAHHLPPTEPFAIDSFVGLSGPYDISHHFDYEAARGVEELSPMKAVCGYSRQAFRTNSPAFRLQDLLADINECQVLCVDNFMPPTVLVHGIEDDTVPFTATGDAARVLRSCGLTMCQEIYLAKTGHQDVAMQLMLGGGKTRQVVVEWIQSLSSKSPATSRTHALVATSKL